MKNAPIELIRLPVSSPWQICVNAPRHSHQAEEMLNEEGKMKPDKNKTNEIFPIVS